MLVSPQICKENLLETLSLENSILQIFMIW